MGKVDRRNDADHSGNLLIHPLLNGLQLGSQALFVSSDFAGNRPGRDRRKQSQLRNAAHHF